MVLKALGSRYLLWLILAYPAWNYIAQLLHPDRYFPQMLSGSGMLSIQLLVFTMVITPITMLLRYWNWGKAIARWLLKSRRYFALAGFGYAVLHTLFYIVQIMDIELIWLEAFDWPFATGWISLIIMIPLAITSNRTLVHIMGRNWKRLQRLTYIAMGFAFTHWYLFDFFIDEPLSYLLPLVFAKLFQIMMRTFKFGTKKLRLEIGDFRKTP